MVQENNLWVPILILLNEYIARVRITVDIPVFENHFSVHLADLWRNGVRVDAIEAEVV